MKVYFALETSQQVTQDDWSLFTTIVDIELTEAQVKKIKEAVLNITTEPKAFNPRKIYVSLKEFNKTMLAGDK